MQSPPTMASGNVKMNPIMCEADQETTPSIAMEGRDGLHVTFQELTPYKVDKFPFMPTVTELLFPSKLCRNKSRKFHRRQMTKKAIKQDIDNLKQYLKQQMKRTETQSLSQCEPPNNAAGSDEKSATRRRKSFCGHALDILAAILYLPCILLELCTRKSRCRKTSSKEQEETSSSSSSNSSVMEDYEYFWDPADIEGESEERKYLSMLMPVLQDWTNNRTAQSWDKIVRELEEVSINDYGHRFQVWESLYSDSSVDIHDIMDNLGLKLMQMAYTNNSMKIAQYLYTNPHITVDLKQFKTGLYRGASPLHLAIINQSMSSVQAILNQSQVPSRELLHLRAESTPLHSIFCVVELPLNLAVWMGDAAIVEYLVESGAEMCATDKHGYNAMHVVALLAEEEPQKALHMFEVLLDLVDVWLEHSTECKALLDLSQKTGRLVAHHMLLKAQDKRGLTPLRIATQGGCIKLVQQILNIDKIYRFPLYKLGPKSESLYDFSEIDPLLSLDARSPSVLEMLVYDEKDTAIEMLGLPQIQRLDEVKRLSLRPMMILFAIFHLTLMILYNVACYEWLFPLLYEKSNNASSQWECSSKRYNIHEVDIGIFIIAIVYMLLFLVGVVACFKIIRRMGISWSSVMVVLSSLQLPTLGCFAGSLLLYLLLKVVSSDEEIFALAMSMLFGWIHCLLFTRSFKATGFFALMMQRVLIADVLRFLSIIAIMVLSYAMMTSAILTSDATLRNSEQDGIAQGTGPIDVMFDFFQLATGIANFNLLLQSSYHFMSGAIYITFLVMANILMFNLLIASMSNRYALISSNGDLLCTKVECSDMIACELMMPPWLQHRSRQVYEHRVLRIKVSACHYLEHQVYLLQAADNAYSSSVDGHNDRRRRQSTVQ